MDNHTIQEEVFFIGIGDPMHFALNDNDNNKLWDTEEEDNEIEEQVDVIGINDSYYSDNMDLEAFADETKIKQNKYKLRKKNIQINKTRRQKTNFLIKLDYDSPCLPSMFCLPTLRSPSKNSTILKKNKNSIPSLPQSTIYLGFSQRQGRYGFCAYFGNDDSRNKEYLIENIDPINLNDKLTAHVIALTRIINDNIAQTNNIKVMFTIRNICKTVKRYLKNPEFSPISEQLAENNRYLYQLKLSLMHRGIQLECDFKKSSQSSNLFIACQKSMLML
jgi:hypothetical protein